MHQGFAILAALLKLSGARTSAYLTGFFVDENDCYENEMRTRIYETNYSQAKLRALGDGNRVPAWYLQ